MKKGLLFIFILICSFALEGCGLTKSKGDGYIVSYKDEKIFKNAEKKKISEFNGILMDSWGVYLDDDEIAEYAKDLTYSEFNYVDSNDWNNKVLIVYNNSNTDYDVEGWIRYTTPGSNAVYDHAAYDSFDITLNGEMTVLDYINISEIDKVEYDVYIYKYDRDVNKEYTSQNDYEFSRYVKDEENKVLRIYFKFKGDGIGSNHSDLKLFCIKDDKIIDDLSEDLLAVDANGEGTYDHYISKKGEEAVAEFESFNYENIEPCDRLVYYVTGYYDDDDE